MIQLDSPYFTPPGGIIIVNVMAGASADMESAQESNDRTYTNESKNAGCNPMQTAAIRSLHLLL